MTLTEPKHTSWSHVGFKPSGNFITDNIAKVTKVTLGPSKHYHMTSALLKKQNKKTSGDLCSWWGWARRISNSRPAWGAQGEPASGFQANECKTMLWATRDTQNWTVKPECYHRDGQVNSTSGRTLGVSAWTLLWWVWYPTARHGCKHRADGIRKAMVRSWQEIQSCCKLSPKLVP